MNGGQTARRSGNTPRTGVQGTEGVEARAGKRGLGRPGRVDMSVHIL